MSASAPAAVAPAPAGGEAAEPRGPPPPAPGHVLLLYNLVSASPHRAGVGELPPRGRDIRIAVRDQASEILEDFHPLNQGSHRMP